MEAGNAGAGPKGSFGVNIKLPYEQHPNTFIADQPTYIDCRYFFTRKLVFVKEAAGAAFFPGGFGHWKWLLMLGAASTVLFLAGYWLFDRLRDSYAEVV